MSRAATSILIVGIRWAPTSASVNRVSPATVSTATTSTNVETVLTTATPTHFAITSTAVSGSFSALLFSHRLQACYSS